MGLSLLMFHHDSDIGYLDDAALDVIELHGIANLISLAHVVGGEYVVDHIFCPQAEGQGQAAEDHAQDDRDDDDEEGDIDPPGLQRPVIQLRPSRPCRAWSR